MKKFLLCCLLIINLSAILLANGNTEQSSTKPKVLRLAHISNEQHPSHLASLKFKEIVEQKTNGNVKIEIFSNASLGSAEEYTEQIKLGALDMGLVTSGQLQVWVPEYAAVMIPFLFESYDHAHRALDGEAGQLLADEAKDENFKILSNWEWGFRQVSNNKMAIEKPDDFKKLKMRVPNEIQLEAMYKTLGATTSIIAFPELYMALAQGVVDGQCNPLSTIYYEKFYEVQKYVTILNHVYNTQMLIMSDKAWNTLTQEEQEIVKEASLEAGITAREETIKSENMIIEKLQQAGVIVGYPDLTAFRNAMGPAIDTIAKFAGKEFTKQFVELVDKAR